MNLMIYQKRFHIKVDFISQDNRNKNLNSKFCFKIYDATCNILKIVFTESLSYKQT